MNRRRFENGFFSTLCVVGMFAILSSTMSKNPVLNPFAESLGTPEALMGLIAAASTVPGILISLPAGTLSDRLGRKKVLLVASAVFASAPLLYLIIGAWWQLFLVRFYHGFATAIFVPVARATIAEYYPARRGERISTFTSATIVGRGIAPFLGGFILSATLWNYRLLYLSVGGAGFAALFITLMVLKEKSGEQLASRQPNRPLEGGKRSFFEGWRSVFSDVNILATSATEAAARYVYGALEFFFIGYLKNVAHLDPSLIGAIMGVQFVLIPVVGPFMGRLSDKVGRRMPILFGLIISGLPLLTIPYATSFLPLLVISLIYGLGFCMVISSTPALIGDLADKESLGATMGFLATIMDVGQMLGPIVTGIVLSTFGYTGSFSSLGAILLGVGLFFSLFFGLSQKRITSSKR
jgi:MFS family permease